MWLEYHYESIKMMKYLKLEGRPDYLLYLKAFPERLRQLIRVENFSRDVVEKSIHMAHLLLNKDEEI